MKILVVEDEEQNREFLVRFLREKKFDVLEARDGEEALAIIEKEKVNLVISDISMPKMGGIELAEHLLKKIPVILMSGNWNNKNQAAAMGIDFLTKPLFRDVLLRFIHKNLQTKPPLTTTA